MADPHDAILEALRLHHVGDISRSEMIGQLVALCEGRYRAGLEEAAKVLDDRVWQYRAAYEPEDEPRHNTVARQELQSMSRDIRALADK